MVKGPCSALDLQRALPREDRAGRVRDARCAVRGSGLWSRGDPRARPGKKRARSCHRAQRLRPWSQPITHQRRRLGAGPCCGMLPRRCPRAAISLSASVQGGLKGPRPVVSGSFHRYEAPADPARRCGDANADGAHSGLAAHGLSSSRERVRGRQRVERGERRTVRQMANQRDERQHGTCL